MTVITELSSVRTFTVPPYSFNTEIAKVTLSSAGTKKVSHSCNITAPSPSKSSKCFYFIIEQISNCQINTLKFCLMVTISYYYYFFTAYFIKQNYYLFYSYIRTNLDHFLYFTFASKMIFPLKVLSSNRQPMPNKIKW